MDTFSEMWYKLGHETKHVLPTVGKASAQGCGAGSSRQALPVDRPELTRVPEFRGALVSNISQARLERIETPFINGQALAAFDPAKGKPEKAAFGRCGGRRPFNRTLDFETNPQIDPSSLRGEIHPGRCMVASGSRLGMELPEARTSRHSAGRGLHCALEESGMATHKKTPKNLGPIWFSSTKADSCSFPTIVKLGPRWGKLLSCVILRCVIGFRRSAHLRSRPNVSDWASTWNTTLSTSPAWRSSRSFKTSCVIFPVRSCCCGMAARFTDAARWLSLFRGMGDFMFIAFHPMHRNSTRSSLFGPKLRTPSQTACTNRNQLSIPICGSPSTEPAAHNDCFDPASMPRSCLGDNSCRIHYFLNDK